MALPLNKVRREPEKVLETKVNMKKQSQDVNDIKETMKGLADRLTWIEAKVDLLATKADLQAVFISLKGKKVPAKKPPASNIKGSYITSSSSDEEPAKKPVASAKPAKKAAPATSSSDSSDEDSDEESDEDEKPAKKKAKADTNNTPKKESDGGSGGPWSYNNRCGGRGFCSYC